jgi:hypothetical protein
MDKAKTIEIYSIFVVLSVLLGIAKLGGTSIPLWVVIAPLWLPIAYVIIAVLLLFAIFPILKRLKK